jgi:hypothetical protein
MLPELNIFLQPVKACSLAFAVTFHKQMDQVASTGQSQLVSVEAPGALRIRCMM